MSLVRYASSSSPERDAKSVRHISVKRRSASPVAGPSNSSASKQRRLPKPFAGVLRSSARAEKELPKGAVVGQWPCFVFAELPSGSKIHSILSQAYSRIASSEIAKADEASIDLVDAPHISLCRPVVVEFSERQGFSEAAAKAIKVYNKQTLIEVGFARFTTLINDDTSRLFWAAEIGLGWRELRTLALSLDERLKRYGAQAYYAEARFHTSFASIPLSRDRKEAQIRMAREACERLEHELGKSLREVDLCVTRVGISVGGKVRWERLV